MSDDRNYHFSAVGKLLQRRTNKTKRFLLSCVPSGKRFSKPRHSTSSVCDSHTQTTPTIHKSYSVATGIGSAHVLQMPAETCVVDSSRNSLDSDSDVYMGSYESFDNQTETGDTVDSIGVQTDCGSCHCLERNESCKWRLHENTIMDKLVDLQQEINSLRATVSSLRSGQQENDTSLDQSPFSVPPPPPPMPPPPPPLPSPVFLHSMSLQPLPRRRQSASKIQFEEMGAIQDRGKPIITLEELQNVKLRHVSSVTNLRFN